MEKNSEVAYTSDIIDIMMKELDMSREKVEANVNLLIRSMKVRSEEPECGSMYLTGVGTMYFRVSTAEAVVYKVEKSGNKMNEMVKKLQAKYKLLKPMLNFNKDSVPQLRMERIRNSYVNRGKTPKEIEEFQNKIYNEHKASKADS